MKCPYILHVKVITDVRMSATLVLKSLGLIQNSKVNSPLKMFNKNKQADVFQSLIYCLRAKTLKYRM